MNPEAYIAVSAETDWDHNEIKKTAFAGGLMQSKLRKLIKLLIIQFNIQYFLIPGVHPDFFCKAVFVRD